MDNTQTRARKKRDLTDTGFVLVVLAILLAIGPRLIPRQSTDPDTKAMIQDERKQFEHRQKVNEYLQELDRDRQLRIREARVQILKDAPPLQTTELHKINFPSKLEPGLDLSQDPRTQLALKDIRQPSKAPNLKTDLDASVNAQIKQADEQEQYDKMYREEYIRQFVANAAQQGYIVSVDKNLNVRVLGVTAQASRRPQSISSTQMPPQ